MTLTIDNNTGKALTETVDGCTMPADTSFATVNAFVHAHETHFEDLQYLCLGLASELDKSKNALANVRDFLASDHLACTYQTMGQYRTAVIRLMEQASDVF